MAAVQVWFHSGLTEAGLPKEPPVGYAAETITSTSVGIPVPGVASIAIVETDGTCAYKGNSAAVLANDPQIRATEGRRYAIDCSGLTTLHIISS